MARMLPSVLPRDVPSPAEPLIFESLRDDPASADWTVLHSLDISRHVKRPFGEADFVVIVPDRGVVVVEAKGVQSVRRDDDGLWYLGAIERGSPVGPFEQARDAMHSIRDHLGGRAKGGRLLITSLVVLPFIDFDIESIEWQRWEVADRRDVARHGYCGVVRRALEGERNRLRIAAGTAVLPNEAAADVVARLRPAFEVHIAPKARLADLEAAAQAFTEEQFGALDAMSSNPRMLFDGPAGTGKTFLAIEAARRASEAGVRTLFLCFNHLLGKALGQAAGSLGAVDVGTIHAHMLRTSGLAAQDPDDPVFWSEVLPESATESAMARGEPYDLLIVDEAQDILFSEPLRTYLDASLTGELSAGRWMAFGDFANQAIFAGLPEGLPDHLESVPRYLLTRNCRNARRVAVTAAAVARLPRGYSAVLRDEDDAAVELIDYEGDQDLLDGVLDSIALMEDRGHAVTDIAILVPSRGSTIVELLGRGRPSPVVGLTMGGLHTIQAYKGLEASAVIVAGIEDVASEYARALLYIGLTRAKHHVRVHVRKDIEADLRRLTQELAG